jgi:acyl carrier protein
MITVEQIHTIIRNHASNVDVSKIHPNTRLREYGIDSMDFFNIILELQDILGMEIPDEDLDEMRTVSGIQEYFRKHRV